MNQPPQMIKYSYFSQALEFHLRVLFSCEYPENIKIFALNSGSCRKQLNKKAQFNFKIYDVTNWETNNYNTHIAQYLKK